MMVRTLYLLLFLFLATNKVFSQIKDSYSKGNIELQDGRILSGFIKDEETGKMNYRINFKETASGKTTTYDTAHVKTLRLDNGELFESMQVESPDSGNITVLAKLITRGKASLYKFFYDGDEIFIIKKDEKIYLLQNDKLENGSTEITSYNFRGKLAAAIAGSVVSQQKIETVLFTEKSFRNLVSQYNGPTANNKSVSNAAGNKAIHFLVAGVNGMVNKTEQEIYGQLTFRTFFPKISRSTSLNVGFHYFHYKYEETLYVNAVYSPHVKSTTTLFSVPLYVQQNILNKKIRPYVFAGINASYINTFSVPDGFEVKNDDQHKWSGNFLFGAGIEAQVYKGLLVKAEYHFENFSHLVFVGVGYSFSF